MSSLAPVQPHLPIAPLDGESGYLRWKESVLLRLHTLGVAHVLTEERPADEKPFAAKQWARTDAMCRGHILATLSDRLLAVYAPHATAAAVWRAVARTYDLDLTTADCPSINVPLEKAKAFRYAKGEPLTEQLALLEGLATNAKLDNCTLQSIVITQFPKLREEVIKGGFLMGMDEIWENARDEEVLDRIADIGRRRDALQTTDGRDSSSDGDRRPRRRQRT